MNEKFVGSYEEAMRFLVETARKYKIKHYDIVGSNSENDKWIVEIDYDDKALYNPSDYWYPNSSILNDEEKIPFYLAVEDNYQKKMKGETYVDLHTSGSTMDFWKDELKKIK